jgi:hypothetical protein
MGLDIYRHNNADAMRQRRKLTWFLSLLHRTYNAFEDTTITFNQNDVQLSEWDLQRHFYWIAE